MKYIHPFYIGFPNVVIHIMLLAASLLFSSFSESQAINIIKIVGLVLIFSVFYFESISHKIHKQAHTNAQQISKLATKGIYSKIRHPIYLGWILLNIGFIFLTQSFASLLTAIVFILLWYIEAKQEEKFMQKKFGKKYLTYKKQTSMFFPKFS